MNCTLNQNELKWIPSEMQRANCQEGINGWNDSWGKSDIYVIGETTNANTFLQSYSCIHLCVHSNWFLHLPHLCIGLPFWSAYLFETIKLHWDSDISAGAAAAFVMTLSEHIQGGTVDNWPGLRDRRCGEILHVLPASLAGLYKTWSCWLKTTARPVGQKHRVRIIMVVMNRLTQTDGVTRTCRWFCIMSMAILCFYWFKITQHLD